MPDPRTLKRAQCAAVCGGRPAVCERKHRGKVMASDPASEDSSQRDDRTEKEQRRGRGTAICRAARQLVAEQYGGHPEEDYKCEPRAIGRQRATEHQASVI